MKSKTILGLMSFVMITACGKGMQVIVNNAAGKQSVPNLKVNPNASPTATPTADVAIYDGKLGALSEYDMTQLKDGYPFKNETDAKNAVRTLGSSAFSVEAAGATHGFVKNSNLVFRAIKQIQPIESIKEVVSLELHLKGVRLNIKSNADKVTLAKQVLCILDTKKCTGEIPMDTAEEAKNLNNNFWKQPVVATSTKSFDSITGFNVEYKLNDDSKTFIYTAPKVAAAATVEVAPKADESKDVPLKNAKVANDASKAALVQDAQASESELVINLKEVFGLADDDAAKKWIFDNSTEFAAGSYRKFQFVIGNNLYAESGQLLIQFNSNDKLPKDFAVQAGSLIHGASDVAKDPSEGAPIEIKEKGNTTDEASASESASPFSAVQDLNADMFMGETDKLSLNAQSKLKELSDKIKKDQDAILSIKITGHGGADPLPGARAESIKNFLIANGVSETSMSTLQSAPAKSLVSLQVEYGNSVKSTKTDQQLTELVKEMTSQLNQIFSCSL